MVTHLHRDERRWDKGAEESMNDPKLIPNEIIGIINFPVSSFREKILFCRVRRDRKINVNSCSFKKIYLSINRNQFWPLRRNPARIWIYLHVPLAHFQISEALLELDFQYGNSVCLSRRRQSEPEPRAQFLSGAPKNTQLFQLLRWKKIILNLPLISRQGCSRRRQNVALTVALSWFNLHERFRHNSVLLFDTSLHANNASF